MALVTLEQAKQHLRIDPDMDYMDDDIKLKIEQASELVLRFLKLDPGSYQDSSGQPLDVPFHASSAVLVWLGILFREREHLEESLELGEIPRSVSNILWQYRDPTYA